MNVVRCIYRFTPLKYAICAQRYTKKMTLANKSAIFDIFTH